MISSIPKLKGDFAKKVLIEKVGKLGGIRLTITDFVSWYSVVVAGETNRTIGVDLATVKKLAKISETPLTFSGLADEWGARVEVAGTEYELPGWDPYIFPEELDFDNLEWKGDAYGVPCAELLDAIKKVEPFICKDPSKDHFNCVAMEINSHKVKLSATTSKGLVIAKVDMDPNYNYVLPLIKIPAVSIPALKMILKNEEVITIRSRGKFIRFITEEAELTIKLLDSETWPDYESLLHKEGPVGLNICAKDLLRLIEKSCLLAGKDGLTCLGFASDSKFVDIISVAAEGKDNKGKTRQYSSELSKPIYGNGETRFFLTKNFLDLLKTLGRETVDIYFNDAMACIKAKNYLAGFMAVRRRNITDADN